MKRLEKILNIMMGGIIGWLMTIMLIGVVIGFITEVFNTNVEVSHYAILVLTRIGSFIGGYVSYKYRLFLTH